MKTSFLILLLTCSVKLTCIAQNTITISGTLLNQHDSSAIAFAHIYVKDINFGTISNETGEFQLKIPDSLRHHNISVTAIGFHPLSVKISDVNGDHQLFYTTPSAVLLSEVSTTAARDTIFDIIKRSIKSIRKNYPKSRYFLSAFYREMSVKDTTYTRLIEAAIEIQDNGYGFGDFDQENLRVNDTRIKVVEVRKSEDFRTYTVLGKAMNFLFGNENNLYKILADDYVRYIGKNTNQFLGKKFLPNYLYELESISSVDNVPVYVISFRDPARDVFFRREGKFYINAHDYAIVKIENFLSQNSKAAKPYAIDGKYFYKSTVTYGKYKGKYYLNHINTLRYSAEATSVLDEGETTVVQFDNISLMVNDIRDMSDGFDKIKEKEKISQDTDLYDEEFKYNPEFWRNYNMILLNPLVQKAKTDIEKETDLESQFQQHR